jgi:uncharacterized protein DUF1707/cell wall-active antibiotic response 4TMS protein YvqF
VHPEPFNANSRLRASDSDREQAATVLNEALAEGRLSVAEHSQRLDAVYEAKTHAEIAPLVDDLPAKRTASQVAPRTEVEPSGRGGSVIVAIFGGATRKGRWHAERSMTAVTIFGGATLDFREAVLPAQEITLNTTCIFGGIEIIVPPEMRVTDRGVAIFGGRDTGSDGSEVDSADGPVLRLTGLTLFGGIDVKHKRRKNKQA